MKKAKLILGTVMAVGLSTSALAYTDLVAIRIQDDDGRKTPFYYTPGCINGVQYAIVHYEGFGGPHGHRSFAVTPILDTNGKPVACPPSKEKQVQPQQQ